MLNTIYQFKEITFEYELTGAAGTFSFYTDQPGNAMAVRTIPGGSNGVVPVTTTVRPITFPLDGIEGALFRPQIATTGALKLFKGSVKLRPIGTYVNGAMGEVWTTREISPGI